MKKVKGFSYDTEKDKDIIEYIGKQPHQSSYIWNLVRDDMNKNNKDIEELVRKYVDVMLKDKNINASVKENKVNKKDLNQLLNIGGV